jgi:tetrahydromethanopterin S-methyltransferase subunit F
MAFGLGARAGVTGLAAGMRSVLAILLMPVHRLLKITGLDADLRT